MLNADTTNCPILWVVVPCFQEEQALPLIAPLLQEELNNLIESNLVSKSSVVLFVDDGSDDATWTVIEQLSKTSSHFLGISLSRNQGHQNALLAGLMEARGKCDISISIDCDGQDNLSAMEAMVQSYLNGNDIVYGVRKSRANDTWLKKSSASMFYKTMKSMGAETVENHADYRLLSNAVLDALSCYKEVNLYLRGLIPLVGFSSDVVYYDRKDRLAGKSHYSLGKMIQLAINGITSFSVKPIRFVAFLGLAFSLIGFLLAIWAVVSYFCGQTINGWASVFCIVCILGGIQLISIGIIGEYVGKTYLETKQRPRYFVKKRTDLLDESDDCQQK